MHIVKSLLDVVPGWVVTGHDRVGIGLVACEEVSNESEHQILFILNDASQNW